MILTLITSKIAVDYGRSLQQMIDAGRYDSINHDIIDGRFPLTGESKQDLEFVLVHFGKDMETSDDVLAKLDKFGLRPVTLPELLALGEIHPDIQRRFPIVALGSILEISGDRFHFDERYVPRLDNFRGKRELITCCLRHGWVKGFRFAAVRK